MGALIRLTRPLPASGQAGRLFYGVGRSLSGTDFTLQDSYTDGRLLGLAPPGWGALTGLGLTPPSFPSPDLPVAPTGFTIGMGTGIGPDGRLVRVSAPIAVQWQDLLSALDPANASVGDGTYLLLLRTVQFDGVQAPPPDPATRDSADPLLDIQMVNFVEVWLSPAIANLPADRTPEGLARAANSLVGSVTQDQLAASVGNGVPIALLMVEANHIILLSQSAGRLPAGSNGVETLLLAQTRDAFALVLRDPATNLTTVAGQAALRARFRFLPGSCELPLGLLLNPGLVTANCPFFPPGFEVYLELIRTSQAANLLQAALGRPYLDLASTDDEAVTLALAIPDGAWTPDLLDNPRADPLLAADTHFAYARARSGQVAWRQAWIALYGGMTAIANASPQALGFLLAPDLAAQDLVYLLNLSGTALAASAKIAATDLANAANSLTGPNSLPNSLQTWIGSLGTAGSGVPQPVPSTTSAQATAGLVAIGYQVVDSEPTQPASDSTAAGGSDAVLQPLTNYLPGHSAFSDWSAAITAASPDPDLLQPLIDAGIVDADATPATRTAAIDALLAVTKTDDSQPGSLIQLALAQLYYAVLGRVARQLEFVLEAHGRFIALQRQHLDIMSTDVSALAGGVPSDGSGLAFTRLIPFFKLNAQPPAPAPSPSPSPAPAGSAAPAVAMMSTAAPNFTAQAAIAQQPFRSTSAALQANQSTVNSVRAGGVASSGFTVSNVGKLLGSSTDIAKQVATDAGALQQAPPFTYQPVVYGTAAHITTATTILQTAVNGLNALRTLMLQPPIAIGGTTTLPDDAATVDESGAYSAIVEVNRGLLSDINAVEQQAIRTENAYLLIRDRVGSLQTVITQLTNTLAGNRDALRTAQSAAADTTGNYTAVQQLVQEEIARVNAALAARTAAINAAAGLFCVRELQSRFARDLPPSLSLTADTADDLAPGCPIDHPGPPAALQPFLDQLLEVPLWNWRPLIDRWVDLPDIAGLQRLGTLRAARVSNWTPSNTFGQGAAAIDLATLATNAKNVFTPVFSNTITFSPSLAASQQSALAVLALPDIIPLPPSLLRTNAEALRQRLESAAGCLFENLISLPPSARFAWASIARAGTLPSLNFAQWPLPTDLRSVGLGDAGAMALRRMAGLVDWMAGQLHSQSSAAAQTALGNLVSAAVIASAYGDPNQTVTGTVGSTGGVPRPGVPIRIVLNRPPPIGTVLNLFDGAQNIVGTLRVQDHDPQGTTAVMVTSLATSAPGSDWTVAAPSSRAPWLPS